MVYAGSPRFESLRTCVSLIVMEGLHVKKMIREKDAVIFLPQTPLKPDFVLTSYTKRGLL